MALNLSSGPLLVHIPNVVSLPVDVAQTMLAKMGLKLLVNIVPSLDIPAKTIIDQDPPGGSDAPPGTTITADVSAGPNAVTVPNVVGSNLDDARSALEQAGFGLGSVAYAVVTDSSPGTVIGQHPAANSQAPQGTSIDVVVASAPASPQPQASSSAPAVTSTPVGQAQIPDVTSMSLSDAQNALTKAGLTVSRVTVLPGSPPNAHVVRTDPAAGTAVAQGTAVEIFLGAPPR